MTNKQFALRVLIYVGFGLLVGLLIAQLTMPDGQSQGARPTLTPTDLPPTIHLTPTHSPITIPEPIRNFHLFVPHFSNNSTLEEN